MLWRFHQVHHSDLDVDCGTAIRHHPVETLIASVVDLALIVALGVPPFAVLISATLTGIANVFNHGNVALPHAADALLRHVVVTPDMHRIHHSVDAFEGNRNFSMLFPWWDRVFSTYVGEPRLGHDVGDERQAQEVRATSALKLLLSPFRSVRVAVLATPR
jgi:sterol desaturase/sphingolipid hydroxylase (fatty acid hydroxylase superfamily)